MLRALDTWPPVAAPRVEDAESDGGHTIALLGAGPFQDLQPMPLLSKKERVTDTTSSVFGGLGNERVRDVLCLRLIPPGSSVTNVMLLQF